jgi:hypothetical protein
MITVKFRNIREIRMGSPFNLCEIKIIANWVPGLPAVDWQNLSASREDERALALVYWDTLGNLPGFRIYAIDIASQTTVVSERYPGCCQKIWWTGQKQICWEAYPDLQGVFAME